MNNKSKQVLIGSILGDGHITKTGIFSTGSKYKEWIEYKAEVLKKYTSNKWYYFIEKNGYSQTPYHTMRLLIHQDIKYILNMSLEEKLSELDELGLAVWFYDDCSFHKKDMRYHLYTNSFTEDEHIRFILPTLMRFGIKANIAKDRKQDGRVFPYTTIGKRTGAQIVNSILKKLPIDCYSYKTYNGNINDTLTMRFIKTTNVNTGKVIIHETLVDAKTYLKSSASTLKKYIKLKKEYNKHLINYYYYE